MTDNKIIYSTGIGPEIRKAFNSYLKAKETGDKTKTNAAYHYIASMCENERKNTLSVFETLKKEL